jgi:hypothetical protein
MGAALLKVAPGLAAGPLAISPFSSSSHQRRWHHERTQLGLIFTTTGVDDLIPDQAPKIKRQNIFGVWRYWLIHLHNLSLATEGMAARLLQVLCVPRPNALLAGSINPLKVLYTPSPKT